MTNPYASPKHDRADGKASSKKLIAFGFLLVSTLWMLISLVCANIFNEKLGLTGQPFINIDKLAQVRILAVLSATGLWTIVGSICLIALTWEKPSIRFYVAMATLNILLLVATVVCAFFQFPKF